MLIKQVGVYVNILNCKLKKHLAEVFKKNGVNLTGEQYLVMDTLWNDNIMLTSEGMALKDSTKQLAINTMNELVAGIPEQDLNTFVSVLKQICDNISDS